VRQFDHYPIFINYPAYWEKVREEQLANFEAQNDATMVRFLGPTGNGARLYEIMEDKNPSREAREYESQVYELLRLIRSTKPGQFLLDSLNRANNYWIVPLENFGVDCNCMAVTFPFAKKAGGGIRMYLSPDQLRPVQERWWSGDDVLFHELVHAYRIGKVGWGGQYKQPMQAYKDAEEFFALQMQNVYLSYRGATRFYLDFYSQRSVSKGTAYQNISSDVEVLMAFKYYLVNDPVLAPTAASWMHPADSYNPFRDYATLEKMLLENGDAWGDMKTLPPLGSMFSNGKLVTPPP
jgi:hypothetical protein